MKSRQVLLPMIVATCAAVVTVLALKGNKRRKKRARQRRYDSVPFSKKYAALYADDYSPSNIGSDASARPWDSLSADFDIGDETRYSATAADKEAELINEARRYFIATQRAWDKADLTALRGMLTPDMEAAVHDRLEEHKKNGASEHESEIVVLEARYLGQENNNGQRIANIEFSGMVRETPDAAPTPFHEIWMMTPSPIDGSKWLVAGVESLS